jgi:hypothetical protein
MNFVHPTLGLCKVLISFESEKNQLHLVTADVTVSNKMIVNIEDRQKTRHWLLWGTKGEHITNLGKTCLLYSNGWRHGHAKAMEIFMNATKTLDNLSFKHNIK